MSSANDRDAHAPHPFHGCSLLSHQTSRVARTTMIDSEFELQANSASESVDVLLRDISRTTIIASSKSLDIDCPQLVSQFRVILGPTYPSPASVSSRWGMHE